jgi:hypothetical protein
MPASGFTSGSSWGSVHQPDCHPGAATPITGRQPIGCGRWPRATRHTVQCTAPHTNGCTWAGERRGASPSTCTFPRQHHPVLILRFVQATTPPRGEVLSLVIFNAGQSRRRFLTAPVCHTVCIDLLSPICMIKEAHTAYTLPDVAVLLV